MSDLIWDSDKYKQKKTLFYTKKIILLYNLI